MVIKIKISGVESSLHHWPSCSENRRGAFGTGRNSVSWAILEPRLWLTAGSEVRTVVGEPQFTDF